MYKCELTLVLDKDGVDEVFSEERVADDPLLGLSLLLRRGMERLSLTRGVRETKNLEVTLMGWVSPIVSTAEAVQARGRQNEADAMIKSQERMI